MLDNKIRDIVNNAMNEEPTIIWSDVFIKLLPSDDSLFLHQQFSYYDEK